TQYLSIYFAGPIRSAGGTAQGQAVLIGEYIRRKIGLQEFRPTRDEVERYVEEIKLYHSRVTRLQYFPSEDNIRTIVEKSGVCIDGDPTERFEVSIHRNLARVDSNRIRGGACLVIAEGVAQKARKLTGYATSFGVDWSWLKEIGKKAKSEEGSEGEVAIFMKDMVGGRPIFAESSAKGGFRLRYGRGRCSGLAAKSIHPAAMILLDSFPATGTQLKVERPGKGCIVTECSTIDGPIVKLKDGSVLRVESREKAREVVEDLDEILFLGDMLVSYGDFLQTNTALLPAGYCHEWWVLEAGGADPDMIPTPSESVELCLNKKIPLHPKYTYYFSDVTAGDVRLLADWVKTGEVAGHLVLENNNATAKRIAEVLGIPHTVSSDKAIFPEFEPLLAQLGLEWDGKKVSDKRFLEKSGGFGDDANGFELVKKTSRVPVRDKAGTYLGARMGRPEKARERKMKPPVHVLFPLGNAGGIQRLVSKAVEKKNIEVESAQFFCTSCSEKSIERTCRICGKPGILLKYCPTCGRPVKGEKCPRCNVKPKYASKVGINLEEMWREAIALAGKSADVKGVMGMVSDYKIAEPLVKGILRASNDVYVYKDGTIRFDATDIPLTHFKPYEISVGVDDLKRLGYSHDIYGKKIERDDQIIELKVQDIIIPDNGAQYMFQAANFIDQLLVKYYGTEPFHNLGSWRDTLGTLVVGLAPHTSAGIIGRIIGFTKAHGIFAHPFWHACKRRNADGDEDAIMLLTDVLLNFSKKYLPASRGGKMDAPLVIGTILDPREVDDEAHKLEVVWGYDLDFYKKTLAGAKPDEAGVPIVAGLLEDGDPYTNLKFTHDTEDVTGPVVESKYVTSDSMDEKVGLQLALAEKIRAVDEWNVANILINSHFLRDTYGNLRAFARQKVRCVKCNESYRRPPLKGKCTKCGGKLILTVTENNITKYLGTSIGIAEKYHLSDYMKQRLHLLEREVESLFTNELNKQASLSDFM
ncbi:MAG TPA: DNA polymerase II large subunit, partial [Candidatus Altiarchaeales archaeon]|nr:DNA polymerase II large subunit [Candidatus Altiarchaeales archaeon]